MKVTSTFARWMPAYALVAIVALAFGNSIQVPFLFDDFPSIVENPSLAPPWQIGRILWGEQIEGATTAGRPLLNLSFALNRVLGGEAVLGYHLVNVALHAANGLLLMGLIRRTLDRLGADGWSGLVAWVTAAWWLVHPLQTAAVSYLAQRAEVLGAFWILLALHAFARAGTDLSLRGWRWVAVAACHLGVLSKETAVVAPVLMLCYERAFLADSWRVVWRRSRGFHAAAFSSWAVLAAILMALDGRGSTAGFEAGLSSAAYLVTQAHALGWYFLRTIWPVGLVFDHGYGLKTLAEVWPLALLWSGVAVGTVVLFLRRPRLGYVPLACMVVLAPSSSIVPVISQTVAEHRMYLPLAAPLFGLVLLGFRRGGVVGRVALTLLLLAAGALTWRRNTVLADPRALWEDTVAKVPENARARSNLGLIELADGNLGFAERLLREARALDPGKADHIFNLALAVARQERTEEAEALYGDVLARDPRHPEALNNLGQMAAESGRFGEAAARFRAAVDAQPAFGAAWANLSDALLETGDLDGARTAATEAVRRTPGGATAHFRLGNALAAAGDLMAAARSYEAAVRLSPEFADAWHNWGNVLLQQDLLTEAVLCYERAVAAAPNFFESRRALVEIYRHLGNEVRARAHADELSRRFPEIRGNP